MNIAIVTPGFSGSDDDWCIPVLQDLARRLSESHRVRVFATTYPHRRSDFEVKGISVSSFGDGRPGRLALTRRMWKTKCAIEAYGRDAPFDVLHGFWADHGGVVTAMLARRLSIPNIVTVMAGELTHDPLSGYGKRRRPIAGRLGRIGARNADVLIALSGFQADQIEKEVPGLATRRLPFGIDTERFSPYGPVQSLQGPVAILCVASMVPAKGHAVILTAFAQAAARQEGLHLHIVGKGDCEAALRQQSNELGISRSVTFHGHVEHHRLPAYYRGASFCVLGSYFESQGMVILEAAASGCATIGSACGSMPEFCPPELLNRPGDSMALANNIQKLATDSELCRQLATKAQEKVNSAFTIEQTACAYEELYRICRAGS